MRFGRPPHLILVALMLASIAMGPPPDRAIVTLELDKPKFFLGENILVHYRLENAGTNPFQIKVGGDYRGASRHLRFKVEATGPDGKAVPDPDPSGFNMGGLGNSPEVLPGSAFIESLPLVRSCRFDEPGTYTLRVKHDLGWQEEGGRKVPEGEARITLVMPTPEQARAVIEEMERLPDHPDAPQGLKSPPYADFTALHYLAYLPLLVERAKQGSEQALAGIGSIAKPDATRALIQLLDHADARLVLEAARTLNSRLPDPELSGKLGPRNPFDNPLKAHRRWLVENSWRGEFKPAVRAHARTFLARGDDEVRCGAFMIECVGSPDDRPELVRALDRAIRKTADVPREQGIYPVPRGACMELLRAARMLVLRGAEVPGSPASPGEAALWLAALKARDPSRPKGWETEVITLLGHEIHYLRALALEHLPDPIPASLMGPLVERLPALLADADVDVQIAASRVAGSSRAPELRGPVLKVLTSAKVDWLLREATTAAHALGADPDALEIWADRLDEPGRAVEAVQALIGVVESEGGYGFDGAIDPDEARALKPRWKAFLQEHRAELAADHHFRIGDPPLTPDLFPRVFHFYRKAGKPWP